MTQKNIFHSDAYNCELFETGCNISTAQTVMLVFLYCRKPALQEIWHNFSAIEMMVVALQTAAEMEAQVQGAHQEWRQAFKIVY